MAFEREEKLRSGTTARYWTLGRIDRLDFEMREARFTLHGYLDEKTAKTEGSAFLSSRDVPVMGADFDKYFRTKEGKKNLSVAAFYEAARAIEPLFEKATDA